MRGARARLRLHVSLMLGLLRARAFVTAATVVASAAVIAFYDAGRTHFLTGIILTLVLGHGVVSRDHRQGTVLLWIQKPRGLTRFYLERLGETLVAAWCAHALVLVLAVAFEPHASSAVEALRQLPAGLLLDLATAAVVFGFSSVGLQPELVPTLVVILVLGTLGHDAVTAPEVMGRWAPLLAAQRFPSSEAFQLGGWLSGPAPRLPGAAWARLVGFPAAWIAFGSLAVHLRARRPPLSPTEE